MVINIVVETKAMDQTDGQDASSIPPQTRFITKTNKNGVHNLVVHTSLKP